MGFTHLTTHRVLYLMHMCLINDAVYQEGGMHLITLNSLHVKCRFICIRDLLSVQKVHIYICTGVTVAKPNETAGKSLPIE